MEVKPGHKQTEFGVIPADWNIAPLGNLTTKIGSGITPTGGEKVYQKEGRPFTRSQNVGWGTLLLDDIAYIDEQTHATFSATEIELNDVLLNITGASIGRSAVADSRLQGGNVNQHVCIIRVHGGSLDPNFLNFFLLSKNGQKQIDSFQAGGNRQGLNFGQIRSFQIPLPPFHEQRAIAAALGHMDALLAALDALIAKKRLIKQGMMHELLTAKRRLSGFSTEWETVEFEDIADKNIKWSITGGPFGSNLKASDYVSEGVRIIQLQNIGDGVFRNDYAIYTTEQKADELISCNIYPGEIILSKMGDPVARACLVPTTDRRYLMASDGIRLEVDAKRFDKRFILYYINSIYFRKKAVDASTGTTRQRIGLKDLKTLPFIAPPQPEQEAIAEILSDMDAEIAAMDQRREKTRLLKQGMVQELLTGRIRLV
jgi:type I restriction enzyme S subunit